MADRWPVDASLEWSIVEAACTGLHFGDCPEGRRTAGPPEDSPAGFAEVVHHTAVLVEDTLVADPVADNLAVADPVRRRLSDMLFIEQCRKKESKNQHMPLPALMDTQAEVGMEEPKPVVRRALARAGHTAIGLHRVEGLAEGLDCSLVHMMLADRTADLRENVGSMGLAEVVGRMAGRMTGRMVAVTGCRVGYSEVGAEDIPGLTVAAHSFDIVKVAAVM